MKKLRKPVAAVLLVLLLSIAVVSPVFADTRYGLLSPQYTRVAYLNTYTTGNGLGRYITVQFSNNNNSLMQSYNANDVIMVDMYGQIVWQGTIRNNGHGYLWCGPNVVAVYVKAQVGNGTWIVQY